MQETIEHGANGGNIAEQRAPVFGGTIRSEQRVEALVAARNDFEYILGGGVREFAHFGVVDDEQRHGRDLFYVLLTRAVGDQAGDSGEVERLFRREAERYSGIIPNTIGA